MRPIALPAEIERRIRDHAVVAVGVSGGRDSSAAAVATFEELDRLGHAGPRLLIHDDLGMVEWPESIEVCEALAARLGVELAVVRAWSDGLMGRWERRWLNNVRRYTELLCVMTVVPWSTPSLRFCTGEGKEQPNARFLVKAFPGRELVNVTGIRAQESTRRSKKGIWEPSKLLFRKRANTRGVNWRPIHLWTLADVMAFHASRGIPLHRGYTEVGMTRISCRYCILASKADLVRSASVPESAPLFRRMVALEIRSSFSFRSRQWLGDLASHLLDEETRTALALAKVRASIREQAEARIPKSLHYQEGWPDRVPDADEARLIADVRLCVGDALEIPVNYTTPSAVRDRYAELIALKKMKPKRKKAAPAPGPLADLPLFQGLAA